VGKGRRKRMTQNISQLFTKTLRHPNKGWQNRWGMYHTREIPIAYRIFARYNNGKRSF
jgi:hypothetical protein